MASHLELVRVVALRKESVDRNAEQCNIEIGTLVALRKESVDRNERCWFGMFPEPTVALRKESVDRNKRLYVSLFHATVCRSPQGERG